MLPFTHNQFIAVFAAYNAAVWPILVPAYLLGLAACGWVMARLPGAGALCGFALAALWAWTGIAYHGMFFSRVNPAAIIFAAAFVAQGALLALAAWRGRLRFEAAPAALAATPGWLLVAYSLVPYPIVGIFAGLGWPGMPLFGITPCPLTLFTLGVLLLASPRAPWWLWPLPLAWSLVGGSAAILLGVPQDWPLLASGFVALIVLWRPGFRAGSRAPSSPAPPAPTS